MYWLGGKVFNMLSSYFKVDFDNLKKFKLILQKFLYENSMYSLDEYFELKKIKFVYIGSKLVFKSLAHKIDVQLCLFYS